MQNIDCTQPTFDTNRPFKLLSQVVYLSQFDLTAQSFAGFTELSLIPIHTALRQIRLNVGVGVQLPDDIVDSDSLPRLTVNDIDAQYTRKQMAMLEGMATTDLSSLSGHYFESASQTDMDNGLGELVISIPEQCWHQADIRRVLKVGIDFQVVHPSNGVHFSCRDIGSTTPTGGHLFTHRCGLASGTRHWLPCVDCCGELCLWRLEFTVDCQLVVVASGDLVETEYTPDMRHKTYQYQLNVPTAATNVGFALGHFEICALPEMSEVTSFCLPGLSSVVRHSSSTLDKVFEFFEELLSCRSPYGSYKQVFVDQVGEELTVYAGLSVMSTLALYHKKILDSVPRRRTLLAHAVAQQFFGCFLHPARWLDVWVVRALARYVTGLFVQRYFGNNEYMYHMHKFYIHLDRCKKEARDLLHFDPRLAETCSPIYADILAKKGHFIMRMLEKRLGKEPLFQVLHKLLTVGSQAGQQRVHPATWQQLTVSTDSFFRTVSGVTGQELPTFLEQWIYGAGHANFKVEYSFNKRRNMIELEINQDPALDKGRQKYVGPLTLMVQELDGSFTHTVQIDAVVSKHDLQCHSKGRRQKRKRIPLFTGEELEVDLTTMDQDSPVLWLRIDPDLLLVRIVHLNQPVYQWEYQLRHEKDVLAQLLALETLPRFPNPQTRSTLFDMVSSTHIFYRVRCKAAFSFVEVANKLDTGVGAPSLVNLFRKMFGSRSCPHIPRPNNFAITSSAITSYFLMQTLTRAISLLRSSTASLIDVRRFLLDLLIFNDNSQNRYYCLSSHCHPSVIP